MQDLLPAVTPRGQEKCGSRLLAGLQPPQPSRQREPSQTPQGRDSEADLDLGKLEP